MPIAIDNSERSLYYKIMKQIVTTATTMTCTECEVRSQRFGTHRNGLQRFRCPNCKKTYTEEHKHLIEDMNLADEKALLALQLFVEGNSLRSTERITGIDINTLMKLLVRAGEKCEKVMGRLIVNIPVRASASPALSPSPPRRAASSSLQ